MLPATVTLTRVIASLAVLREKEEIYKTALKVAKRRCFSVDILRHISDTLLAIHLEQIKVKAVCYTCMTRVPH